MKTLSLISDLLYAPLGIFRKFISGIEPELRDETKTCLLIAVMIALVLLGLVVYCL